MASLPEALEFALRVTLQIRIKKLVEQYQVPPIELSRTEFETAITTSEIHDFFRRFTGDEYISGCDISRVFIMMSQKWNLRLADIHRVISATAENCMSSGCRKCYFSESGSCSFDSTRKTA